MDRSTLIRADAALPLDASARMDVYGAVHKGLRALMFDTLVRLGATDAADARQLDDTLRQARLLLDVMRGHLGHENTFVHPMIEAARPGGTELAAEHHAEHERAIDALVAEIGAIDATDAGRRPAALYRLYLRLARFVAENLEHMELEETHHTALLRDAYDDDAIGAMVGRIHASITPPEAEAFHRWMFVGMSHDERVGLLSGMRAAAPAAAFDAEVARARDVLAPRDWGKLAAALGLPAVAGLVEIW